MINTPRILKVLAILVLLAIILARPRTQIPSTPRTAPTPPLPPGWTVDHRTAPEFVRPREILLQDRPTDPREIRLSAAGLRARARTDGAFLADMIRALLDPATPDAYRSIVALVLGTLEDPAATQALLGALQASTAPAWTALLLHALGAQKTGEDDEAFDLPEDGPDVYVLGGLSLAIHTRLDVDGARSVASRFLGDADLNVRRAACRALIHSAEKHDVRSTFLASLGAETDEGLRAGFGWALAGWTAANPGDADGNRIVGALLDCAARPDDDALRFRIEEPLRRAVLDPAQVARLIDTAERGTAEQQLWSLSILKSKVSGAVEASCGKLSLQATDSKVRQYAVDVLGVIRTPAVSSILERVLIDPEWNVRIAGVRALSGRQEARPVLERTASGDSDERVRQAAAEALKLSSNPR